MNFENAANTYKQNAIVQKNMAKKLVSFLIKNKGNTFKNIFEIGSGTGFLTNEIITNMNFEKLVLNDITPNFTGFEPDLYLRGDICDVKIPYKFDLILSSAVFQWIGDYEKLFKKLQGCLNKNGVLAFTTFGEKNFIQIKEVTGIGLEYQNFDEIINKYFKILYFESELETIYFNSFKELLEHITLTGVKIEGGKLNKKHISEFLEKYKDNNGFELTYHPMYYVLSDIA